MPRDQRWPSRCRRTRRRPGHPAEPGLGHTSSQPPRCLLSGEAPFLLTEPGRCRQLTVRRSKRKALLTIRASRAAASPAKLVLDLTEGSCSKWAVTGGTWGASAITITDALTVDLQQHPAQWTSRNRQVTYRPQPARQAPLPGRGPSVRACAEPPCARTGRACARPFA